MTATVRITTGARLHFGPLAVRAVEGCSFGGVGMMIDSPGCVIEIARAGQDEIVGAAESERVTRCVDAFRRSAARPVPACRITLLQTMPRHAGLGSGTQLALAVGRGLAELSGERDLPAAELARRVGRGKRSAIGIHGFQFGGFIVDAGKPGADDLGQLACRLPVPESWRFLLIRPPVEGLSGRKEERAFESLPPMPAQTTDRLCRIVLTRWLPALQQGAFAEFCAALDEYGALVGEYFRPVQGGLFADRRMERLAASLYACGVRGVAQSSWGPTIAVCCENEDRLQRLQSEIEADIGRECRFHAARPLNTGAAVVHAAQDQLTGRE